MRGVTLQKAASRYVLNHYDGTRVRITAASAVNMPTAVFAYRLLPTNPQTGQQAGFFSHVCSSVDLAEWPENDPVPNLRPQWFRLPYVDVLLRSRIEAENFITKVYEDVDTLKLSMDAEDTFVEEETVVIGDATPTSSSTSSETSHSSSSVSEGPVESVRGIATTILQSGPGAVWTQVGLGAGEPISSSSSSESLSFAEQYSKVDLLPGQNSQLLLLRGYTFGPIPPTAKIVGIHATLMYRDLAALTESSAMAVGARVNMLQLSNASGLLGNNRGDNELVPGPDFVLLPLGADDDDWDTALTGRDVSDGDFGLALMVRLDPEAPPTSIQVGGSELTIFYRTVG